jgi:hypothetical protein
MDNRLNFILNKYNNELKNYVYINDIRNINEKTSIRYISKNNLSIKNGYFRKYIDPNIIELYINSNKIWYIYADKYYFFYKKSNNDVMRDSLQSLVDSGFKIIKKN